MNKVTWAGIESDINGQLLAPGLCCHNLLGVGAGTQSAGKWVKKSNGDYCHSACDSLESGSLRTMLSLHSLARVLPVKEDIGPNLL